jgi:hypothetical protein
MTQYGGKIQNLTAEQVRDQLADELIRKLSND